MIKAANSFYLKFLRVFFNKKNAIKEIEVNILQIKMPIKDKGSNNNNKNSIGEFLLIRITLFFQYI